MAITQASFANTSSAPPPEYDIPEEESVLEIPKEKLPETFSEKTIDLIQKLRSYAERSGTIGGELCADAAQHIEDIYKKPKDVDQKLETFWIEKHIPRQLAKNNPEVLAQQHTLATQELATVILATKCATLECAESDANDVYIYRWKVQFAEPPNAAAKPTLDDVTLRLRWENEIARQQANQQAFYNNQGLHVQQPYQQQAMAQNQAYAIQNYQGQLGQIQYHEVLPAGPWGVNVGGPIADYLNASKAPAYQAYPAGHAGGIYTTAASNPPSINPPMSKHDMARAAIAAAQKWVGKP